MIYRVSGAVSIEFNIVIDAEDQIDCADDLGVCIEIAEKVIDCAVDLGLSYKRRAQQSCNIIKDLHHAGPTLVREGELLPQSRQGRAPSAPRDDIR